MYTLETKRLHLRPFQLSDWDALNNFLADPEVTRYMHFRAWTEEKRRQWLAWCIQNSAEPTPDAYNWAITLIATGQLIGWLGIGTASHPTVVGERDFGYALNRDFWGKGYMPEALGAVLRFEFETLKTTRIYGECELENPASARVMEKVGMQYEGLFLDDDFDECHRYAIYPHQLDSNSAYSSFNSAPNK